MSRLAQDPHPRTTRKPSAGFTSAAARLLLRHAASEAANVESIGFFSALRKCLPDPQVSRRTARGRAQRADGRGKVRRGGSADEVFSMSSEVGKQDYDWLLTPPGTPLRSPATSCSGHQVSGPVPTTQVAMARSALSAGRSNPRLGSRGPNKDSPRASRLSKCSSATSLNVVPPSGRLLRVRRTSSVNTVGNASVSSKPLRSAASSPRTLGTARSAAAAAIAQPHRRDDKQRQATTGHATVQPRAPAIKPKPVSTAPSSFSRAQSTTPGVSRPKSTASTSRQTSLPGRVDVVVARSRLARQSSGTGSKSLLRDDAHPTRSTPSPRVVSSSNAVNKSRPAPAAVNQDDGAAATSTRNQQMWRHSLSPATAAAQNVRRESSLDNGSPRNSAGRRKVHDEKATATPFPTGATTAVGGTGLTRTGSGNLVNAATNSKRTVNDSKGCRRQDAKHGGGGASAPANRKPTLLQETSRSVISRNRLVLTAANTKQIGLIAGGGRQATSGSGNGCYVAAPSTAMARVAGQDAFPSMRYDAMLLREDPKNLNWLGGCDEGDDDGSGGGMDLVHTSLDPF